MLTNEIGKKLDRILDDIEFMKNRISIQIGDGLCLTYLANEIPIYVNTGDFGCPTNLINGGTCEEENFWVLDSFFDPATVFLESATDHATL